MNKLLPFFCLCSVLSVSSLAAQITAKQAAEQAAEKETADESVAYLKKTVSSAASPADKRALYALLGSVQEQLAQFDGARDSYAAAAGIAAGDADGMPARSSEQLVLDAVRCALSSGEYETADSYLNSAVRNSPDEKIQAYIKLYAEWSALCKAPDSASLNEPVVILNAYASLPSMKVIKPSVLLTLWYITGKDSYARSLKAEFPASPETAVIEGSVQMLPAPFWFFVPRQGSAQPDISDTDAEKALMPAAVNSTPDNAADTADKDEKITREQLGLFREKSNADALIEQLRKKGFAAYIATEKRPSGTTYFTVVVDENASGSVGAQLRTAGFECYPVFSSK